MKRVRFDNTVETIVRTEENWDAILSSGTVVGVLQLSPFVDPKLCSADMGYFQVSLLFKSSDGEALEYSAVLPFSVLWPSQDIACSPSEEFSEADLVLSTILDSREAFEVRLADGSVMAGIFKYVESRIQARVELESLAVRLTFYWAEAGEYRTVAYRLPLSSIMWRRATIFGPDDFNAQGANYVNIKRFTKGEIEAPPSPVKVKHQPI
jgi:hypothetical protein